MWRGPPWVSSTVSPVFDSAEWVIRATSTPTARNRSRAIAPSWSGPRRVMKPILDPRAPRLWAVMAEELPRVTSSPLARSSCSTGNSAGRPYRIRSRLISPAMVMSNLGKQVLRKFVEDNNLAQIGRRVRVESFFQAGIKAQKLAPRNAGRKARALQAERRDFDQHIGGRLHASIGVR